MTLLKTIVVCLVLANVGYFLWAHGAGAPQTPVQAAPTATLKLASESPRGPTADARSDGWRASARRTKRKTAPEGVFGATESSASWN